jgi:gluconokinase
LAERTGGSFIEADDLHPAENIRRMSEREPLTDADRWPWLKAISELALAEMKKSGGPVIIACSALKRSYRDVLRQALSPLSIVHLSGPVDLIRARLEERPTHFMPIELLDSQIETLEAPDEQEGVSFSIEDSEAHIVAGALQAIGFPHRGVREA